MANATVCPQCSQRLSVPDNRGELRVTCPKCRNQFDWSPEVDERQLSFRCASTGQPFAFRFRRFPGERIYRLVGVVNVVNIEAANSSSIVRRPPTKPHRGLLARLLPRLRPTDSDKGVSGSSTFSAADFDFSGWFCPFCGWNKHTRAKSIFARCGRCEELVCGARIVEIAGGKSTFACHNGCGGSGTIAGSLESYTGSSRERKNVQHRLPRDQGMKSLPPAQVPAKKRG